MTCCGPDRARRRRTCSGASARSLASPRVSVVYADSTSVDPVIHTRSTGTTVYRRPVFSCYQCFFPVTDVAFRPYLRYVRR